MTRSKKAFAELLVQAQGFGDAEEIAKEMSLVDIIYKMKKAEEAAEVKKVEEAPQKVEEAPQWVEEAVVFESIWSRISPE